MFLRFCTYAIVLFTIWFLWPRELDGSNSALGEAVVPDYRMENSRYVSVKDGARQVESYGSKSSFDFIARIMKSDAVTSYFYDSEGKKTVVTGDKGIFFMDQRYFHLIGNVRSESPDGFVITGPEAYYYVNDKRLESPQPTQGVMKDGSLTVWGDRAIGYMDTKILWLYGNARANFLEKKHGISKIRGDKAEMDRVQEKVQFFQNVKVEQENTVGTGETGTLFYTSSDKSLRYMSLNQNVKIEEEDGRYTRSQVAEFFMPTDTIVLTGFPALYDSDDVVTGDKITLYRTTGVVEVLSANGASTRDATKKASAKQSEEDDELIP